MLAQQEIEKNRAAREHRERLRACTESWAAQCVDGAKLKAVVNSPDALSVAHFVSIFAPSLGIEHFSVPEFELGLSNRPLESSAIRRTLCALLRHSDPKLPPPPPQLASGRALSHMLAERCDPRRIRTHRYRS